MKVVILCGGQGMRLREETEFRPKPLVEIGGYPILWHIMQHYSSFGYKDFVLCLGYKGNMIKDYFLNYHLLNVDVTIALGQPPEVQFHQRATEDWKVTCANTGQLAHTGARIKKIQSYIGAEDFMLTYGDGVANVDIHALIDFHRKSGRLATVTGVYPPARWGELVVQDGRALEFREKPQAQKGRINGGFLVCSNKVFDYLTEEDTCQFERGPMGSLADEGQLGVYCHDGFWQCMDTYRDFILLNEMWDLGEAPWRQP